MHRAHLQSRLKVRATAHAHQGPRSTQRASSAPKPSWRIEPSYPPITKPPGSLGLAHELWKAAGASRRPIAAQAGRRKVEQESQFCASKARAIGGPPSPAPFLFISTPVAVWPKNMHPGANGGPLSRANLRGETTRHMLAHAPPASAHPAQRRTVLLQSTLYSSSSKLKSPGEMTACNAATIGL